MRSQNIHYKTDNLVRHYRNHRIDWSELYPSEREVFEHINPSPQCHVLDVGCACGGLGIALRKRFGITNYTGVEINDACVQTARSICPWGIFHGGDFLDVSQSLRPFYDLAVSLSCVDWNIETDAMLHRLFALVRPRGHLVFSCRLTNDPRGGDNVTEGHQEIVFDEPQEFGKSEKAPYKVYTLTAILKLLTALGPVRRIYAHGYSGKVPATVSGLPFREVFHIVFSIQKAESDIRNIPTRLILDVPAALITGEETSCASE